jgi:sugar transferase (PEP-CTERM/EpsH1 system associated)
MRHLLFLSHRLPFPPDKGDKIRSYHILKHLTSRFRVHLGSFYDDPSDAAHIPSLRAICDDLCCLPLTRSRKVVRSLAALARNRSMTESVYRDERLTAWISRTIEQNDIRDVFVYCSAMAPYVLQYRRECRIVTDLVDIDSLKWHAYANEASPFLSALYRLEHRNVSLLEKRAVALSEHALFVSDAEAREFLKRAPEFADRVASMKNGVDLQYFDPSLALSNPFPVGTAAIVFTGAMDYRPNVDAVNWFAQQAFPAIRRCNKNAEFWIVGANPSAAVAQLSRQSGIRVTGRVVDTRPFLAHAACAIAPLRIARGIQNKVLEAMAMAKPVVLTTAALEGLGARPGTELILADRPDDFAASVLRVLSGLHNDLGPAARQWVARHHDWARNLAILDGFFPDRWDAAEEAGKAISQRAKVVS